VTFFDIKISIVVDQDREGTALFLPIHAFVVGVSKIGDACHQIGSCTFMTIQHILGSV